MADDLKGYALEYVLIKYESTDWNIKSDEESPNDMIKASNQREDCVSSKPGNSNHTMSVIMDEI